ncbi:MAG: uncharacterized protein KVP18_002169 [Porospora cf. gigantea A]|uniref:uncharacterized protein n=1 Tax=Porospora cf. gigantea A TaxID=2853593 RepID=UPI00355A5E54|nr:MAG: hypothetical protein KVP18_002169 [Porospora cf. gigantea A]
MQSWASKAMDTFKYKPHRRQKTIEESRGAALAYRNPAVLRHSLLHTNSPLGHLRLLSAKCVCHDAVTLHGSQKELSRRHLVRANYQDVEQLVNTGYSREDAKLALKVTRNNHWNSMQFLMHLLDMRRQTSDSFESSAEERTDVESSEKSVVSRSGVASKGVPPGPPPRSRYAPKYGPKVRPPVPGPAPPRKATMPKYAPKSAKANMCVKVPGFVCPPRPQPALRKDAAPLGRRIFWKPLGDNKIEGTVFSELAPQTGLQGVEFDSTQLRQVFAKDPPAVARLNVDALDCNDGPKAPRLKQRNFPIFPVRRAQNLCIVLASLKVKIPDAVISIRALDDVLSMEVLQKLEQVVPSEDESKLLDEFLSKRSVEELRPNPEQVLAPLRAGLVPLAKDRIRLLRTLKGVPTLRSELAAHMAILQQASREVMDSRKFRQVLSMVLRWGNFVNHGIATKGELRIQGFTLESLLKIVDFRSMKDSQIASLHYIVVTMMTTAPELQLDALTSEMPTVASASRIPKEALDNLTSELSRSTAFLDAFVETAESLGIHKEATDWGHVREVASELTKSTATALEEYHRTFTILFNSAKFFGHDAKLEAEFKPEEYFGTLDVFLRRFHSAVGDIKKNVSKFTPLLMTPAERETLMSVMSPPKGAKRLPTQLSSKASGGDSVSTSPISDRSAVEPTKRAAMFPLEQSKELPGNPNSATKADLQISEPTPVSPPAESLSQRHLEASEATTASNQHVTKEATFSPAALGSDTLEFSSSVPDESGSPGESLLPSRSSVASNRQRPTSSIPKSSETPPVVQAARQPEPGRHRLTRVTQPSPPLIPRGGRVKSSLPSKELLSPRHRGLLPPSSIYDRSPSPTMLTNHLMPLPSVTRSTVSTLKVKADLTDLYTLSTPAPTPLNHHRATLAQQPRPASPVEALDGDLCGLDPSLLSSRSSTRIMRAVDAADVRHQKHRRRLRVPNNNAAIYRDVEN